MVELKLKGPQVGSDLGTVAATVGGAGGSTAVPSFAKPAAVTGLPRISDAFDDETFALDETGLTGITARQWRVVGGANLGTAATQPGAGQAGNYITCDITCDQGVLTAPAIRVYESTMMGMPMTGSHRADDEAIIALVPHAQATHIAIADGDWDAASTWLGGTIPYSGARVLIPNGRTVSYGRSGRYRLDWLRVDGQLNWALDRSTYMLVETVVIARGGAMLMGTAQNRLPAQYTMQIEISGKYYDANSYTQTQLGGGVLSNDQNLWGRGIISQGRWETWGANKTQWLMASEGVAAGATSITLEFAPTGWQVGDEICISGTTITYAPATDDTIQTQEEYRTITSITNGGRTLNWTGGLTFNHNNQLPGSTRTDIVPQVFLRNGNNITISSEVTDVNHLRGHTACVHMWQTTELWNTNFIGLGRTDKRLFTSVLAADDMPDDGTSVKVFPGNGETVDGNPVIIDRQTDSNVQGRYPVHMHHPGHRAAGSRPRVVGCYMEDAPGHGYVDHGGRSDFFDNVCHLFFGCGMVSENGAETGVWVRNLMCGTTCDLNYNFLITPKTLGGAISASGDNFRVGYGFGMRGRAMRVNGNVACSVTWGYVFYHRGQTQEAIRLINPTNIARANMDFQTIASHRQAPNEMDFKDVPIIHFEDNMAQACISGGFITKEAPQQNHDFNVHLKRFKSFGYINTGFTLEYIGGYLVEDFDLIAGRGPGQTIGFSIEQNTYQVGFNRIRTEGNAAGIRIFDALDAQGGMQSKRGHNNTNNPRWYILKHDSINDTTAVFDAVDVSGAPNNPDANPPLLPRDQDLADVLLKDQDWDSSVYDAVSAAAEDFPFEVGTYSGGIILTTVEDNADGVGGDGRKTDQLGVHKVNPKSWREALFYAPVENGGPIFEGTVWGAFGFNTPWKTIVGGPNDGDVGHVFDAVVSDRANGRPTRITHFVRQNGFPLGTGDGGAYAYTDTAITGHSDKTVTVALNGAVTVDVLGSATGGNGTVSLSELNYYKPGHGEITFNGDGTVDYTPDAGYVGVDTWYHFLESGDPFLASVHATVRVDVLVGPGGLSPLR